MVNPSLPGIALELECLAKAKASCYTFARDFCCGNSSVVERLLAKEKVAGSNPVYRSNKMSQRQLGLFDL